MSILAQIMDKGNQKNCFGGMSLDGHARGVSIGSKWCNDIIPDFSIEKSATSDSEWPHGQIRR